MAMTKYKFEGTTDLNIAQRFARYGRKDWVGYHHSSGEYRYYRKSRESIKQAMLASGTKGDWLVVGSDGILYRYTWWMGLIALRQIKLGYM